MICFFLLSKRPRDIENVISFKIRATAMIFEYARIAALFWSQRSNPSQVSPFVLGAPQSLNALTDLVLSFDAFRFRDLLLCSCSPPCLRFRLVNFSYISVHTVLRSRSVFLLCSYRQVFGCIKSLVSVRVNTSEHLWLPNEMEGGREISVWQ